MNRLSTDKRAQILSCLVEGNSIRSTVRMTGAAKNTVTNLLVDAGEACWKYQDKTLRNLSCKRLQLDEIWSFVYAKARNVPPGLQGKFGYGDVWTWTAICADTKLVPSWFVASRNAECAMAFVDDLASRLANRVQVTTDGHNAYLDAMDTAFGGQVDYSMLVKHYGQAPDAEKRYSPPVCVGVDQRSISGNPDSKHISTSYAERQNLTMRMHMRRFTRLTNSFSKRLENLAASVSLHFMWYNFARVHMSLRVTPSMEAGVSDHVWELEEIAALLDSNSN